ncbi:MAG: hypothetical protein Q9M91_03100 [Candidatus Dojkabacteria bacterium]|nr:hypothetical protein [Candidatus Dojkabacteria bacterium]
MIKFLGERITHVLSNQSSEELESLGTKFKSGYISSKILKDYLKNDLLAYNFYICGPPVMMKFVEAELKNSGVSSKQIFMERFSI